MMNPYPSLIEPNTNISSADIGSSQCHVYSFDGSFNWLSETPGGVNSEVTALEESATSSIPSSGTFWHPSSVNGSSACAPTSSGGPSPEGDGKWAVVSASTTPSIGQSPATIPSPISTSGSACITDIVKPLPTDLRILEVNAAQFAAMRRMRVTADAGAAELFHKVPLGEKGRMELKAAIRAAMKDRPELREKVNTIAKLRCATIPQLLKIAHICDLWELALEISRRFVETRNGKQSRQAAIRRLAKSANACILTERARGSLAQSGYGPVTLPGSPPACVRVQPSPTRRRTMKTSLPPFIPPEYRLPLAVGALSNGDGIAANSTTAGPTREEEAWNGVVAAVGDLPTAAFTEASGRPEWQPIEQSYYDMYIGPHLQQATPTTQSTAASSQWMASQSTASFYPVNRDASSPTPRSVFQQQRNSAPDVTPGCLFDGAVLPLENTATGCDVINPPEQLAAISQFGLWAAEASPEPAPGYV